MDSDKPKNAADQKAWDLMKECRHQGAEGARRLIAELPRLPPKYRDKALQVLALTHAPEAQEYLLSLAVSATNTYAAVLYLENNWNLAGARQLLALNDMSLLVIKHFTKHKIPSDADILEATPRLLQMDNLMVRGNCAYYLETDTSTNSARQKAEMLIQSLQSLERIPAFTNRIRMAFDVIHVWTEGGHACRGLINALVHSGGVSLELLRELTPVEPGLPRDSVLVARSWMKDSSVKSELYRIIREQPVGLVRFHAVNSFMRNGDLADVPELEWVAAHDPLFGELDNEGKEKYRAVLRETFRAGAEVPDRIYPIREAALETIRRIGSANRN